jgi:hypothetical protein
LQKKYQKERKLEKGVAVFIDRLAIEEVKEEEVEYFVFGVLKGRRGEKKGS